jgi:hypothetical protein
MLGKYENKRHTRLSCKRFSVLMMKREVKTHWGRAEGELRQHDWSTAASVGRQVDPSGEIES